jgi:hypothetical protein
MSDVPAAPQPSPGPFASAWSQIWVREGALASWMERTGTERKKLIAVGFYLVFLVLMIVVLTVVSSGADPDDWHFMAYLAFLVVAGLPSATLAERLGG